MRKTVKSEMNGESQNSGLGLELDSNHSRECTKVESGMFQIEGFCISTFPTEEESSGKVLSATAHSKYVTNCSNPVPVARELRICSGIFVRAEVIFSRGFPAGKFKNTGA
jgi:hypothetical protein